jgi:hypothetical protein
MPTQPETRAEYPATTPPTDASPPPLSSPLVEPQPPFDSPAADAAERAVGDDPVFPGRPPADPGEFPQIAPAVSTPQFREPSYASALRRRRKQNRWGLVIPLLGGIVLISIVIYFFVQNRPRLNGALIASAVDDVALPPGGVGRADVGELPKEVVDYVLDELAENPIRLTSSLMRTEFRGTRRGIEVRIFEGSETRFFRVAPGKNEHFADWVLDHADELEEPHYREFQSAVKRFFVEFADAQGDLPDLSDYRDSLGLNATVGRVGYNMAAIVAEKIYRCVYEDDEGRLFFLLPRKTRQFELVGRKLKNGQIIFPGHYDVEVK